MSLAPVVSPYQPINGLTGLGLNDGAMYIGVDGQDPETNPQACFWDAAGTTPATQPIAILGGYPMRLGTPTRLYTASTFSIRVRDATGAQVFYEASAVPGPSSGDGVFNSRAAAAGASIPTAVRSKGLTLLGYYSPLDGGGASYRYATVQSSGPGKFQSVDGAWWEFADRPYNVRKFGAKGDGVTDDTAAFAEASACGVAQRVDGSGVVFVPDAVYVVSSYTLRSTQDLIGASRRGTVIQHKTGAGAPLFVLDRGPVTGIRVQNLTLMPAGDAGEGCFHLQAQAAAASPFDGGLWYSNFSNLELGGTFKGYCFWLRGGPNGSLLPHQLNTFSDIYCRRSAATLARALLITGQVAQHTFINFNGDGPAIASPGVNWEISRQFTNGAAVGGALTGGVADGDNAPRDLTFITCTCQGSSGGVYIDRGQALFDSCWFEQLRYAVEVQTASVGTKVLNSRFANAASDGAGTGFGVKVGSTSTVTVGGNVWAGTVDHTYVRDVSGAGCLSVAYTDSSETGNLDTKSQNITRQLSVAAGALTVDQGQTFIVNGATGATTVPELTTINSWHPPGAMVTIKAHAGTVRVRTGIGNITTGKDVVLREDDFCILQKFDLGAGWGVVGANVARLYGLAVPASGYYESGEFVWYQGPFVVAGKILLGWTRMVTGYNHVMGVDWSPVYVTNS